MRSIVPILWWNTSVFALVDGEVLSGRLVDDQVLGFCGFVEKLEPTPKSIRLIYHSAEMECVPAVCPKGGREVLRKALSPKFAALASPGTTWGAHRVRTNDGGSSTLLYVEESGRLAKLRTTLADRGIVLEAAFPMLAVAELTPPIAQAEAPKPAIALLYTDEAAAVFWVTADGTRQGHFYQGEAARERVIHELFNGLSVFDAKTPPAFAVFVFGERKFDLTAHVLPFQPTTNLGPEELLAAAFAIKKSDLANLLPPPAPVNPTSVTQLAAALLLAFAGVSGVRYVEDVRAARANIALQQQQEGELTRRVSRLEQNRDRIIALQRILDDTSAPSPTKAKFLEELGRTRPVAVTVHSVAMTGSTWTVAATAHDGVGVEKGPYQTFVDQLGKGAGWSVNAPAPALAQSEFTLSGGFR